MRQKYGANVFAAAPKKNFFKKLIEALSEPMMIILIIACVVTLGTGLGKLFKTGEKDFSSCVGVFVAIVVSVTITLVMERSSQKAFEKLSAIYSAINVKVLRNGTVDTVKQSELVVGDIVFVESGSKISADGVLLSADGLVADESALTGESRETDKTAMSEYSDFGGLSNSDRLYSGTFVLGGFGKMLVTAVGEKAEIGKIASNLSAGDFKSPLSDKLSKLGKKVTIFGAIMSALALILSVVRMFVFKNFTFDAFGDAFITSVILIVAVVPEGLPTTVAVSLALNMTRLAKKNVLIKKMTASETAGAVSVICTDKTGTLTENKMTVDKLCVFDYCTEPKDGYAKAINENFCLNSTADLSRVGGKVKRIGSATECALLEAFNKGSGKNYQDLRKAYRILGREPFSSDAKYMSTLIEKDGARRRLYKGAPEKIISACRLDSAAVKRAENAVSAEERKGRRVLAFAHADEDLSSSGISGETKLIYDGFASILDPIRKDAFGAVKNCKTAGIDVKILTGDNIETAAEIAGELHVTNGVNGVYTAAELDKLDDTELKKRLPEIKVVARSTPTSKLRLVKALRETGEVVAVTGDGMNDAPAIKNADIGIAMGISGSEISREAADVVLLDDAFSSIVTAIAFGRKLYQNIQRFVTFQLTVNFAAVALVVISLALGLPQPFNTLQLLWINIIMDGPPALSLGLNSVLTGLLDRKPVGRNASIVTRSMAIRIALQGALATGLCILESMTDFMGVGALELSGTVFALFVTMQLFNAFNCIEIGKKSIFGSMKGNGIMIAVFGITLALQIIISAFGGAVFSVAPLSVMSWLKIIAVSALSVAVSEVYKLVYRHTFGKKSARDKLLSSHK